MGGPTYITCTVCGHFYHTDCLDPPMTHVFRSVSWVCPLHDLEKRYVRLERGGGKARVGVLTVFSFPCCQRRKQPAPESSTAPLSIEGTRRILLKFVEKRDADEAALAATLSEKEQVRRAAKGCLLFFLPG
jgi:hypothetical protein